MKENISNEFSKVVQRFIFHFLRTRAARYFNKFNTILAKYKEKRREKQIILVTKKYKKITKNAVVKKITYDW